MNRDWIAIDWGTSNFRAFLMQQGSKTAQISQPCGLLNVTGSQFEATLEGLLRPWLDTHGALAVVMAGMVGSQQGWKEVPYTKVPCKGETLAALAHTFTTRWGSKTWIVPGLSTISQFEQPDAMRGEEVQLLGLAKRCPADSHFALLPGTHSKHATLKNGAITAFSTFMTGELFSVLTQHSLLGRALPAQQDSQAAFLKGVDTALHDVPFSHLIFSARTRRLNKDIADSWIHSYLSGLLIGYELRTLPGDQPIWIVGNPSLIERYQLAAGVMKQRLYPADGDDCFLCGLGDIATSLFKGRDS
ncbi:2-dehydro-3-deoxygalactonokinase [Klebsiella michiganensis]|nr:2-dehydro-3-deoxygalactonokinase [Klebsiella michiganensis]